MGKNLAIYVKHNPASPRLARLLLFKGKCPRFFHFLPLCTRMFLARIRSAFCPPPSVPTLLEKHLEHLRLFYQSAPAEPTKGGAFTVNCWRNTIEI